jgi:hypothetical protein
MTIPSRVGISYELRHGLLSHTQQLLRERSRTRSEAYTVWVGEIAQKRAVVRDAWPVEANADARHAAVAYKEVLELASRVAAQKWYVLAQLHTHGGRAFHSATDDAYPISSQKGFISIVVPNFGEGAPGEGWAYYEHEGGGRWRALSKGEVKKRFLKGGWWNRLLSGITGRASY